jgi:hypothetical protein
MYMYYNAAHLGYYNLDIRSYFRLRCIKSYSFFANVSNDINFCYTTLLNFLYAALWRQCIETKDCSLVHGLLCVSYPATRHGSAWGERRYSSCSFLTSALDGGEWSATRPGRALSPGKEPRYPLVRRLGGPPEPVWTQKLHEKSSAPVGDWTPVVQSVVRHCTDWATSTKVLYIFPLFVRGNFQVDKYKC